MNKRSRPSRLIAEAARRSIRAVERYRRAAIAALALALAVGMTTLAPRALSDAATTSNWPDTGGITWVPVDVSQNNDDGTCWIEVDGDLEGDDTTTSSQVGQVKSDVELLAPVQVNANGVSTITVSNGPSLDPVDAPYAVQANVDCSLITQTDAYFKKLGYGSTAGFARTLLDAYQRPTPADARAQRHAELLASNVPEWVTRAVSALASAAVYFVVSGLVVAAATAVSGPLAGLAATAVAGLAGCLGGVAATYTSAAIFGVATSESVIGGAVANCLAGLTGEVVSNITVGRWLGSALGSALGLTRGGVEATSAQVASIEMAVMGADGASAIAEGSASVASSAPGEMVEVLDWLEGTLDNPT